MRIKKNSLKRIRIWKVLLCFALSVTMMASSVMAFSDGTDLSGTEDSVLPETEETIWPAADETGMPETEETDESAEMSTYNLLLMGGAGEGEEAEVAVLITINDYLQKVFVTAFRKDLQLSLNGVPMRLGQIYAQGGTGDAKTALQETFGLHIEHVASSDYKGLAAIIDDFGGADITVSEEDLEPLNSNIEMMCQRMEKDPQEYLLQHAGSQHVNGLQAVSYMRLDSVGDYEVEDSRHIQEVMISLLYSNQVTDPFALISIIGTVLTEVHHDLGLLGAVELAGKLSDSAYYYMEAERVPKAGLYEELQDGTLVPTLPDTAEQLCAKLYEGEERS